MTIILKKELIVIKIYNIYLSKESHNIRSNNENDIDIILIDSKLAFKNKQYLMQSIIYVALNPYKDLYNLEKKVYPTIAKMYNDSTHNIKCRINVETTEMYFNCNTEKLMKYFNFSVDIKPKVKTVINTILRNVF